MENFVQLYKKHGADYLLYLYSVLVAIQKITSQFGRFLRMSTTYSSVRRLPVRFSDSRLYIAIKGSSELISL